MRALIQRVSKASVTIDQKVNGSIENGLLVFLGICEDDSTEDIEWLSKKIAQLRIFSDDKGLMNKSVIDINGNILVISQFTLFAQTKKGNRPSFIRAARPETAIPLYEEFCSTIENIIGKGRIKTGIFGADMKVSLINDGPVTIWIDSHNRE
jgi:D-tyrosyl-tRNA(Tyr) deacylase